MAVNVTPLKRTDNASILDAIRAESSDQYMARIPEATQGGVQATLMALTEYRPLMNEFISSLVNRIGTVIARNNSWTNPFAQFKRGMLTYGNTIEEIQTGLLNAHGYDPDRDYMEESLFGSEVPETKSIFHTINRQNFYKVTINDMLLRRAFLEDGGLSAYVNQLLTTPSTSDNWDEFLLMTKLFSLYERMGGFFHVAIPDVAADTSAPEDAKAALRAIRAFSETLKFISTRYNAAHMPISAQPDELILFTTPGFKAAVDVEALAAAFNVDYANVQPRIITIPDEFFGIPGCQAILTTAEFFVCADTLLEVTSQFNPASLNTNQFLHHHQIVSTSLFAPAVMFTTNASDVVVMTPPSITTVSAIVYEAVDGVVPTTVKRGGMAALIAEGVDANSIVNSGVRWTVTGNTSIWTYITAQGVLHVAPNETAATLTVSAFSAWIDPSNVRANSVLATKTVTLATTPAADVTWPEVGVVTGIEIAGVALPGFAAGTLTYAYNGGVSLTKLTKADVIVASSGVSATVTVAAVTGGWTVTVVTDAGIAAAPVTYTVNVTHT